MKTFINESKRMQKLANILVESLKFKDIENKKYKVASNFSHFKEGEEVEVKVIQSSRLGDEIILKIKNNKGQFDTIQGDRNEDVDMLKEE